MPNVLLAEDDPAISEPLARALRREGYDVGVSADGPGTFEVAKAGGIDLIVLDIGLPRMDGLEVCRRLRSVGQATPVLILTARVEEVDTVIGLDAGADDYVAKPFRLAELLARVRALLRRGATAAQVVQGVRIDTDARRAWLGDRELDLTSKEFDLLYLLVSEAGKVVTRDQIMRQVWDSKWWGSTKTLDMHVSWLRRKLGDDAHSPHFITTVRGVGFRFERGELGQMQRRLLTAMLAVAAVAVLALTLGVDVGLVSTTGSVQTRLSVVRMGLLAAGSVVLAATLALAQARRLTRAVRDLAKEADRIGSGDTRPVGRRYGIGELDRVAESLDNTVQRVTDLISAEQDFAVDASHQLRTPLTALSMRLEEMVAAADDADVVREEGAAALAQTDRLAQVVRQLLGRARRSSSGAPRLSGIDDIITQQVMEWEPAFRAVGRKLEVAGESGLRAYISPGGVSQVIATLLDNALTHGGGTVTVRASQTPRSVVIEVKDEGKGIPAGLVHRIFERSVSGAGGTGLGLALAKSVASSDGGQLVLVRPRPATFAVIFPQPAGDQLDEPVVAGPA